MKKATKVVLWKIYFWIIITNSLVAYSIIGLPRFLAVVDLVLFLMAIFGLYAFVWEKTILSKLVWKIYFWAQLSWNITYMYLVPMPESILKVLNTSQFYLATQSIIFYAPLFYALYSYSYKQHDKMKNNQI